MIIRYSKVIVFVILFMLIHCSYAAAINLNDEIKNIPANISAIYHCGQWQYKNQTGFYRIIYIEFHYGNSLLYVQWIADPTAHNDQAEIKHTLSIKEFNANDHIDLFFDQPKCIIKPSAVELTIKAFSGHDGSQTRFKLKIFNAFGQYLLKKIQ